MCCGMGAFVDGGDVAIGAQVGGSPFPSKAGCCGKLVFITRNKQIATQSRSSYDQYTYWNGRYRSCVGIELEVLCKKVGIGWVRCVITRCKAELVSWEPREVVGKAGSCMNQFLVLRAILSLSLSVLIPNKTVL